MSDPEFGRPVEVFDALPAEGEAATRTSETLRTSIGASIQSILDAQTDDILRKAPAAGLKQSLPKGTRFGSLGHTRGAAFVRCGGRSVEEQMTIHTGIRPGQREATYPD
ncbi:hypothetical protein [Rhodococcus sp. 06-221-2]|uniref:hypothetical protein n=1 Tax=Rhodococcus sp. 06-221-2 TaxID=2022514 RepID=UPI00117A1A55|nr:hypothetical protein [Rhodococcus sp. 06-221-2]